MTSLGAIVVQPEMLAFCQYDRTEKAYQRKRERIPLWKTIKYTLRLVKKKQNVILSKDGKQLDLVSNLAIKFDDI